MRYKSKDWVKTKELLSDKPSKLGPSELAYSLYMDFKQTGNSDLLNMRLIFCLLEFFYKWRRKDILDFISLYNKLIQYSFMAEKKR